MNEPRRCAAPWRGLHITPQGDLKTCCSGANLIGNVNDQSVTDLLSKPILAELRQSIRSGSLHPEYCNICIQAEKYGTSERDWHNGINPDLDYSTDTHKPTLVDLRWNTTCNLACNYCGSFASSKWEQRIGIRPTHKTREFATELLEYVKTHSDTVREVALVGGEPLLLPENEILLDVIPKDCVVTIITNCNVDLEKNVIVKKLFERNRVGWSMSFDNTGSHMEYVRHGASWVLTDKNVRSIVQHFGKGHWGGIHAVYNIFSCTRIRDLRRYANSVGIDIVWQSLIEPKELDVFLHSRAVKDLALQELRAYKQEFGVTNLEQEFFTKAEQKLNTDASLQNLNTQLLNRIYNIEQSWHTANMPTFADLWPDIAKVL